MLGTHFLTNLHAHDRAAFLAGNVSTRDEAKPWTFRIAAKNGDWVWLESFGKPDLNAEGRNVGRTAYLRDVTDRERATASLHKNLRILDSVAHISGIGGWSLELAIRFFAPEAQPLITQAIVASTQHPQGFFDDIWLESTLAPMLDARGAPDRMVSLHYDISERKALELQQSRTVLLRDAISAIQTAFNSGGAHNAFVVALRACNDLCTVSTVSLGKY